MYGWERDDDHDVDLELMMRTDDDCELPWQLLNTPPDFEDEDHPDNGYRTIGEMMEAMTA